MCLTISAVKEVILEFGPAIGEFLAREAMVWVATSEENDLPVAQLFDATKIIEVARILTEKQWFQSSQIVVGVITDFFTTEYIVFDNSTKQITGVFDTSFHDG